MKKNESMGGGRTHSCFTPKKCASWGRVCNGAFWVFVVFCVGGLFSCASKGEKNSTAGETLINGHEFVDLGLSVKWATCNVGASSPSDYGDYFAWGEVSPKSEYTAANCVTWGKTMGDISGDSRYDAARVNWGGSWRLPTKAEMQELKDNCIWRWTTQNGKNGYKVMGLNRNSIFLPAAGYRDGWSIDSAGPLGVYWSSTPGGSDAGSAFYLHFLIGDPHVVWNNRYRGRSMCPVSE